MKDMFKLAAKVFQQIMIDYNEAESEEDKILAITKICIKNQEGNWLTDDYVEYQLVKLEM
jgi:hypothetical protein